VFTLTWSQVDWNGSFGRLEPGTTKDQEGRAFPITPALRVILERRQELTRRWNAPKRELSHSASIEVGAGSTRSGAPLASRVFHDLRRSAVRNLERASEPRSVAMNPTGHKTESIYRATQSSRSRI
jgi:integrase